jgi:putative CocE/NonD family hydrolase
LDLDDEVGALSGVITERRTDSSVQRISHTWIEMSDGCRLSARVWLPADAEQIPVPAILEYIPYRKSDATSVWDEQVHGYFAQHGYAGVRVDIRGSGDSEGILRDEYLPQEQDDALEVIEWIASQPWCSGEVGMIGISWGGFTGLQAAARRPPALRAVVSMCSSVDRYRDDIHYMGGCVLGTDMLSWATTMLAYLALPPDPAHVGDSWRSMWLDRLDRNPPFVYEWLSHQRGDAFWKHASVAEDFGAIECPVLMVGGWADAYRNAVLRFLAGYDGPCKGIIGPWSHHYPYEGDPGPAIGFLQECIRWWDHWLKGVDTGVMEEPALRAWMQDSMPPRTHYLERPGRWVGEPSWPSPNIEQQRLSLTGNGGLSSTPSGGTHEVVVRAPQITGADAGDWMGYGRATDLPGDQRVEDERSVTFDSEPLAGSLELLGRPRVMLEVSADRPLALVCTRLCDVHPDGSSTLITRGLLNLTHRDGHEHPTPLVPGERYSVVVDLNAIGYSLPAGHRLRVALSPTYWPWAWPSPAPATLIVITGGESAVELPVRPPRSGDEGIGFDAPAAGSLEYVTDTFPAPHARIAQHDVATGRYEVATDFSYFDGCRQRDGLDYRERARDSTVIVNGEPLSAETRCERTITIQRDRYRIRVEARATMTSTGDAFLVTNEVDAYEGNVRVAASRSSRAIPRDLV